MNATYAELAVWVLAQPPRLGPVRLVAVDGPSGAGKTWFARRLAVELGAPVVHTDHLLLGWADQFTFWSRLDDGVLTPLRRGRPGRYERHRWGRWDEPGEVVTVEAAEAVVVEGVSAARAIIRPEVTLAVYVTAPAGLRARRTITRDGDDSVAYRAYVERWRRAEEVHFAEDATAVHAGLLVDGAAEAPYGQFRALRQPPH